MENLINFKDFKNKNIANLSEFCLDNNILCHGNKHSILFEIMKYLCSKHNSILFEGFLEITNGNFGMLRDIDNNFLQTPYDIYVHPKIIKDCYLKIGDQILCEVSSPKTEEQKFFSVTKIVSINGKAINRKRVAFEDLTPIFPSRQITFESLSLSAQYNTVCRLLDLVCPMGFGQRAIIVAPPKSGKTTILHAVASSISHNYKEAKLIIVLVGERPEEVTEMKRIVPGAEIVYSTFDESGENQIKTTEMINDRAKRLVENGQDVVVLLDSITRLVRSYNSAVASSGRVLSGGIEPASLQKSKKFFGSARNTVEGGSLTIISTCLVETGSKMDECIFEEMKGTSNSDMKLNRLLSEKRQYPPVDIRSSGTRRVELFMNESTFNKYKILENFLTSLEMQEAIKFILDRIRLTKTNKDLIVNMQGQGQ
jgi:transcription termination factor Rho